MNLYKRDQTLQSMGKGNYYSHTITNSQACLSDVFQAVTEKSQVTSLSVLAIVHGDEKQRNKLEVVHMKNSNDIKQSIQAFMAYPIKLVTMSFSLLGSPAVLTARIHQNGETEYEITHSSESVSADSFLSDIEALVPKQTQCSS